MENKFKSISEDKEALKAENLKRYKEEKEKQLLSDREWLNKKLSQVDMGKRNNRGIMSK